MDIRPRSRYFVPVIAVLALVAACATLYAGPDAASRPAMEALVTAEWLAQHLDDPDLVALDCTVTVRPDGSGGFESVSGRADYDNGHIPTAGFADLLGDLSGDGTGLSFSLPAPEAFAAAMGTLGVGDDSRVVLYSSGNPAWAARVWWMLRWIGFDRAALLDGGKKAWTEADLPLSTQPADRPPRHLSVSLRPELIADRDEVRAAIDDPSVTIVDALPEASFLGTMAMYARPGHISGASNIPATALTDESGRFRPLEELAARFPADHSGRVITYCGGGIAASSDAFVMTRAGFTDVAVYIGSLQEWTADPENPMETGPRR